MLVVTRLNAKNLTVAGATALGDTLREKFHGLPNAADGDRLLSTRVR